MINFPSSPIHGNTYDYQGIRYTFIKKTPAGADIVTGYWAVTTPGTYGVATGAEVDAGTDGIKYVSPEAMEDSSYIKQAYVDQALAPVAKRSKESGENLIMNGRFNITNRLVDFETPLYFSEPNYYIDRWYSRRSSGDVIISRNYDVIDGTIESYARIRGSAGVSATIEQFIDQGMQNTLGKEVTVVAWLKASDVLSVGDEIRIELNQYVSGSGNYASRSFSVYPPYEWTKYEWTVTLPNYTNVVTFPASPLNALGLKFNKVRNDVITGFRIAKVSLHLGGSGIEPVFKSKALEEVECARFYEKLTYPTNHAVTTLAVRSSDSHGVLNYSLKRIPPTITTSGTWEVNDGVEPPLTYALSAINIGERSTTLVHYHGNAAAAGRCAMLRSLSSSSSISLDAELYPSNFD